MDSGRDLVALGLDGTRWGTPLPGPFGRRRAAARARIDAVIADNPGQAAAVAAKPQAIGWFVGAVMRQTAGKANPAAVNQILRAKLIKD